MVINHLEKLFITSDAATIIRETDVHHPAAKMIAQAAKMQENECGDGTNLLISMAGELMTQEQVCSRTLLIYVCFTMYKGPKNVLH